jgi:hypothetical protein
MRRVADTGREFIRAQKDHMRVVACWFAKPANCWDRSYRCDEQDLPCQVDWCHDENGAMDRGARKGRSQAASHREWVVGENGAASKLV